MKKQVDPEALEKAVLELNERIKAHREYIAGHETRTRVVLIDPLLRALGWNLENPDEVQLEFKLSTGKPDYALMKDGQPIAVIEAKRLGTRLESQNPGQVIKYTDDRKFSQRQVVAFTNGEVWRFFRASKNWDAETVDLSSIQTFKTAFDLVECLSVSKFEPPPPRNNTRSGIAVVPTVQSNATPLPEADWKRKPVRLRFEDGSEQATPFWTRLYIEIARHVVDRGLVSPEDYPVVLAQTKQPKKCAMNTSKVHLHGTLFRNAKLVREGIWLENNLGSNKTRWQYSVRMLERFGIDPMTVLVEYASSSTGSAKSPPPSMKTGSAR